MPCSFGKLSFTVPFNLIDDNTPNETADIKIELHTTRFTDLLTALCRDLMCPAQRTYVNYFTCFFTSAVAP